MAAATAARASFPGGGTSPAARAPTIAVFALHGLGVTGSCPTSAVVPRLAAAAVVVVSSAATASTLAVALGRTSLVPPAVVLLVISLPVVRLVTSVATSSTAVVFLGWRTTAPVGLFLGAFVWRCSLGRVLSV